MWQAGCYLCFCYSGPNENRLGTVLCSLLKCKSLKNCNKPEYVEGACCPICADDAERTSLALRDDLAFADAPDRNLARSMRCQDLGLVLGRVLPHFNQGMQISDNLCHPVFEISRPGGFDTRIRRGISGNPDFYMNLRE